MPARLPVMNLPPQISYHYPCPDGVFAALAAHLRFSVAAQKVIWVPNAVYAPKQVNDLQLQVRFLAKLETMPGQCLISHVNSSDRTNTVYA